ncbi:tRNA lysidine(34) synthetase TilS [Legionella oakridgensis]|uniref:tRNA lysidine(34) synthetase TilS n=1 Tax=Legionella oakridgensis TaxID=29423 RepID=UPI0003DE01B9|nr:tRNA lysidine(34) synthetase TilS [Legionella oakridgensis]ETO93623.1 tRNA(Ile)-lysidine synthetase [Legionella oakridgensis RV-2-2007]
MTESLLSRYWLERLSACRQLFVGFSGGLDSTVLLHHLTLQAGLREKLHAIHIHHGLSIHADAWQAHCQRWCDARSIPLTTRQVKLGNFSNIEEKARIARYQQFSSLLSENDCLLLGHHADDQAETMLLQLLRGAGIDGLAAMAEEDRLAKGWLARPFLAFTRQTLEDYARAYELDWIEDESNQNPHFARNYLRHTVMPLLRAKWPSVATTLMRSASHCQQAKMNLETLAVMDCQCLTEQNDTLPLSFLASLDRARVGNVLRVWLKKNQVRLPPTTILRRLIDELIFASQDANPHVQWDDVEVRRYQRALYLLKHQKATQSRGKQRWAFFPQPLSLDGMGYLYAEPVAKGLKVPAGSAIEVGFREGGETLFWHGQTKQLKKLMQQWRIPPWQRDSIPLIYINGCLAAVADYAISDYFLGSDTAYQIQLRTDSIESCIF